MSVSCASAHVAYLLGVHPLHRDVGRVLGSYSIGRDERILVAVSGGADSTALLYALLAIGQPVAVGHVHHGLRGATADADAAFVRQLGSALGVPAHIVHVDARVPDGRSPEARARELRYAALESLCTALGCRLVATAHTRDDQAETVLLRAIRGSGIAGLAAIRGFDPDRRLVRPMLQTPRAEGLCYLRERGLDWVEDQSNADVNVPRNRVRHEALPALEAAHPGATGKLAELAGAAGELAALTRDRVAAARLRATAVGDGGVWIEPTVLAALEPALRRATWIALLRDVGLAEQITRVHLVRIEDFALAGRSGAALSLPAGRVLVADRTRVWLGPGGGPHVPAPLAARPLERGVPAEFPDRGLRLSHRRHAVAEAGRWLIPAPAAGPLDARRWVVRSPQPGDRLAVQRKGADVSLRDLIDRAGWSRAQRARAVVVVSKNTCVWMPGLAVAEPLRNSAPSAGWWAAERLSSLWESC